MTNLIIPTTVVDNFFDNPDAVREFALAQEFTADPEHRWPGKRSRFLHEINPELFSHVHNKFFNLFYSQTLGSEEYPYTYRAHTMFQLIDSNHKVGWVHWDQQLITVIIYLNKNPNKDAGTAIYSNKNDGANVIHDDKKRALFSGAISEEEGEKYRLENNNRFQEEIVVKNKYNRLLAFDAHLPHGVQDYSSNDEPRLTLVSFIGVFHAQHTPIQSMRRTK